MAGASLLDLTGVEVEYMEFEATSLPLPRQLTRNGITYNFDHKNNEDEFVYIQSS